MGEALERRQRRRQANEEAEEKKEATRKPGTRPSHGLAEYGGGYRHPGYGGLRIEVDGETLKVHFNSIEAPLEHWHYEIEDKERGRAGRPGFDLSRAT